MNYRRILLQLLADIGRSGQDDRSLFLDTAADAVTEALKSMAVDTELHIIEMTWADVTAWAESELERTAT